MVAVESEAVTMDLQGRLAHLARSPRLLVACDYDGTLAPIVDDPAKAFPRRETVVAIRALAELPQTSVAVISGRALRDLAMLSRLPEEIRLVGSHGGEFDVDFVRGLDAERRAVLDQMIAGAHVVAADYPGAHIEPKPAGLAFHVRRFSGDGADRAIERVVELAQAHDGVNVRHGKAVVELSVVDTNKGKALETIRSQVGASAVIFIGDDRTDEDAFATLSGPDVGIKVGPGDTLAGYRVDSTDDVTRILADLAGARSEWIQGSGAVPIEAHSILSDLRTAAIVSPDARVTWLCTPRIDSAAMFAELVGGPVAGYFSVAPISGARPLGQEYDGDTLILRSRWPRMTVIDYLDTSRNRITNLAGRTDLVRVVEGSDHAVVEFAPRLDFGRVATRLAIHENGLEVAGTSDLIALRSPGVEWELVDDGFNHTARAIVDLRDGPVTLELRCGSASLSADPWSEYDRRRDTHREWADWAAELDVPSIARDDVLRSALLLRSLVHGPTGAIVAAATTSLPEHLGGVRNWDYRYCWIRDGALTAVTLAQLGAEREAMAFLDWVTGVVDERGGPQHLNPLYLVTGRHLPPEAEIGDLAGYAGSRPVRVGNAADHQIQLDVFGPLADLVLQLAERGAPVSATHWQLVSSLVDAVRERWVEPDHGIWEIRAAPRHHVYSKVMCWQTVDRAVTLARMMTQSVPEGWEALRDDIAADVLEHGWRDDLGTFTAAYGRDDLDASVLAIGLSGLLPEGDNRLASTVEAIEHALREGPTVWRYRGDDGLPGREGGFHLMTSWLIDAYELVGRREDAVELFEELRALIGPTGLLAEEYDPMTDRSLGNLPQAYSHLGLIQNALRLDGRL
ncbi:MAG: trehalose-phosphatase [Actinomycetota bacterium]|jgi:trehalose 6-phosphate phosphatase|nr:trehalose-phosphatase [Actinomycetota bacterium]